MNILFVYMHMFNPQRGGIERVTDILAREFIKRGHQVFYLNNFEDKSLLEYPYPATISFFPYSQGNIESNKDFYLNYLRDKEIDMVINQYPLFYYRSYHSLIDLPNVHTISVIHSNPLYIYNYLFALTMRLRNNTHVEKVKRVLRIMKVPRIKFKYLENLRIGYQSILKNTDMLCLLSMKFIPDLRRIYKGDLSKVIAIGNPNTYGAIRSHFSEKKKQLLYVGRVEWYQKRADRLVYIWKHLYKQFPDWELVIVGDGPIRSSLEKKFQNVDRVKFTGYQDPKAYYEEASILCMTSDFEGWPMVLMEAMTFGTVPILFNSFAAATDIVNDGQTGVLVSPFSLKEYVRKLSTIMADDCLRKEMSKACTATVTKFDVEHVVDQWETVFRSLTSKT